jgi:hypothetical protein
VALKEKVFGLEETMCFSVVFHQGSLFLGRLVIPKVSTAYKLLTESERDEISG